MFGLFFALSLIFGICFGFFIRLLDYRREERYIDRMYDVFLDALNDALQNYHKYQGCQGDNTDDQK